MFLGESGVGGGAEVPVEFVMIGVVEDVEKRLLFGTAWEE